MGPNETGCREKNPRTIQRKLEDVGRKKATRYPKRGEEQGGRYQREENRGDRRTSAARKRGEEQEAIETSDRISLVNQIWPNKRRGLGELRRERERRTG